MGELVNLNKARKQRARGERRSQAAGNRAVHGATRSQRSTAEAEKAHLNQVLDGARIERPDDEPA